MENPYAPPQSPVDDVAGPESPSLPGGSEPAFFAVSIAKLVVLSICTLGLYELYWYYRNWRLIKAREKTNILPFWRAFFGYFFCYPFFVRVRDHLRPRPGDAKLAAGLLATCWIVTSLMWRLKDPYWLVSTLSFVFLIPVQLAVNHINEVVAPGHDRNSTFSAWNWMAIFLGGVLFLAAVIGTLAGWG